MTITIKDVFNRNCAPYCSSRRSRRAKIKNIVVHYTAVPNASAKHMAQRFARTACDPSDRKSSAHYVVDSRNIVYHAVPDDRTSWHVGAGQASPIYAKFGGYEHSLQWHANHSFKGNCESIGVELCCRLRGNDDSVTSEGWVITDATINHAAELCAMLCHKYNLTPDCVIRHYDATGKPCPRPFVSLPTDKSSHYDGNWIAFTQLVDAYYHEAEKC